MTKTKIIIKLLILSVLIFGLMSGCISRRKNTVKTLSSQLTGFSTILFVDKTAPLLRKANNTVLMQELIQIGLEGKGYKVCSIADSCNPDVTLDLNITHYQETTRTKMGFWVTRVLPLSVIALTIDVQDLKSNDVIYSRPWKYKKYLKIEDAALNLARAIVKTFPTIESSTDITQSTYQIKDNIDQSIPVTNMINRNSIAIIIGNKSYNEKDIPIVDYAHNDIKSVKSYLIKVLGYKEGNIIYEEDATRARFRGIFGTKDDYQGKLYNWLKRGKSDIFIYYSGHGAPDTKTKLGYFVPVDADPQNIALTGYSVQQMYDNVAKVATEMETPNVFIFIDACFSGASEKGLLLKNVSPISIDVSNPTFSLPNAVIMTSSSGEEVSSWYPEKKHSMFTYFFLKALKDSVEAGKESITVGDIFNFITDDTEGLPYWARRLHGRIQTPQLIGDRNRVFVSTK